MIAYRTLLTVGACNILLWLLLSQLNHYLTPLHLHVFAGGLFVAFSSLRLGRREAWRMIVFVGLWVDASSPLPFGTHALLFLCAHTILMAMRTRLPREELMVGIAVALVVNAALYFVLSISPLALAIDRRVLTGRLLCDLLLGELAIVAIAPWFFALQERALEIVGASLRRERRSLF